MFNRIYVGTFYVVNLGSSCVILWFVGHLLHSNVMLVKVVYNDDVT